MTQGPALQCSYRGRLGALLGQVLDAPLCDLHTDVHARGALSIVLGRPPPLVQPETRLWCHH